MSTAQSLYSELSPFGQEFTVKGKQIIAPQDMDEDLDSDIAESAKFLPKEWLIETPPEHEFCVNPLVPLASPRYVRNWNLPPLPRPMAKLIPTSLRYRPIPCL